MTGKIARTLRPALGLAMILGSVGLAFALPSLLPHLDDATTILWESDGLADGSSAHNHRSSNSFRGADDRAEPFSAFACWDNRNYRVDLTGAFDEGHCFIDTSDPANVPRYIFEGGGWPAGAQERIRDAFAAWSSITTYADNRVMGLAFMETTDPNDADIRVRWDPLDDFNVCGGNWTINDRILRFDGLWDFGHGAWSFDVDPSNLGDDEWHFYSVALHEVGHVVGLAHQDDKPGDLMAPAIGEPADFDCDFDGETQTYYVFPDAESRLGAEALYAQTAPIQAEVYCDYYYGTYNSCEVFALSGTPPFAFGWTGGGTGDTWTGSCYGFSPRVTVTDANGEQTRVRGYCSYN